MKYISYRNKLHIFEINEVIKLFLFGSCLSTQVRFVTGF